MRKSETIICQFAAAGAFICLFFAFFPQHNARMARVGTCGFAIVAATRRFAAACGRFTNTAKDRPRATRYRF
jgi:hypothetical protein